MNKLIAPEKQTVAGMYYTPEQLALGEGYYRLFTGLEFGARISDCFNPLGSAMWAHFIRIQEKAYRDGNSLATYDVVRNEIQAIHGLGPAIAQMIVSDPDFDIDNLIVLENGSGSKGAVKSKTMAELSYIEAAGGRIAMYSPWEKSAFFHNETLEAFQEERPHTLVNPQEVDFTKDDPDLSLPDHPEIDVEGPRIVLENGTPRSNIATTSPDELPFDKLRELFRHDYRKCRKGGILILNCDGDQNGERNEAKYKDSAHAQVGQIFAHHGQRQGVISENYEPLNLYYRPIWEEKRSIIRHTLIEGMGQSFGVLRSDGKFHKVRLNENDGYDGLKNVFSHSIKWTPELMCDAANAEGFKTLMAEPLNPADPQNYSYMFKAG